MYHFFNGIKHLRKIYEFHFTTLGPSDPMPEKPSNQPPSTFQPRPYNGGMIRKMITLIAMLVMVLYAMKEAGKPENWAWMGFLEQPTNTSKELSEHQNENKTLKAKAQTPPISDHTNPATTATTAPTDTPPTRLNSPVIRLAQTTSPSPLTTSQQQAGLPAESAQFWTSFFNNLETTEQIEWMDLLETLSGDRLPNQLPANQTQTKLITLATKRKEAFNNTILDRISSLPHASEKRSQVSQDHIESNKFWQQQILPALTALKAAEDITLRQQQSVGRLLNHLDTDALNLVRDKTAIGWTGDSVAWKRCWNRIHQSQLGAPTYVTRIQLTGQPREYRGRAITVNGFVRSIETRRAKPNSSITDNLADHEQQHYYILWVQPADSSAGPYCVYCLNPPEQLPRTQAELEDYQWLAKISGIFFKNRSYQATDRVRYSPLILADSFEMKPPATDHPVLKQKLSPQLMAGLLAMIPLIAVGIVWYSVRSTVSRKRFSSKKSQEELKVFLGDLKDDPSIESDQDQMQARQSVGIRPVRYCRLKTTARGSSPAYRPVFHSIRKTTSHLTRKPKRPSACYTDCKKHRQQR